MMTEASASNNANPGSLVMVPDGTPEGIGVGVPSTYMDRSISRSIVGDGAIVAAGVGRGVGVKAITVAWLE